MNVKSLYSLISFLLFSFLLCGCATSINSYPVGSNDDRKGGLPYYMPKPMLAIKQPIETSRKEEIFAIISLGGVKEFIYKIDVQNFDQAIKDLEKLIKASPGSIKLEELKTKSIYLTEETTKKAEHDIVTKKYATLTAPSAKEIQASLQSPYTPTDIEKSIDVILIPDFTKEYELVIDPAWFSSLEVGVTLTDGWRLDGLTSKSGENQIVGALKDIATTVIGAQKDVDVAKIGKEQALRLKELEIESAEGGEKALEFMPSVNATLKIKGYLKKTSIQLIEPGIYDLTKLIGSNSSWSMPTINSEFLQLLQL